MIHRFMSENRWQRIKCSDSAALSFMQKHEMNYVNASSRFLKVCDHVWAVKDKKKNINALLLHTKDILFPVFNGNLNIPSFNFLNRFIQKNPLHAVQGLKCEVEALENGLSVLGIIPDEIVEYDLMNLNKSPNPEHFKSGPRNLVIRRPGSNDVEELFHIQTAYDKEEVLRTKTEFNPAVSRLLLERIMANELILIAEIDGRILGKINTNAASFSSYQIGGVYVKPEYRGMGIASRLTAIFVEDIIASGKGVSLFVKKQNLSARALYKRVGFSFIDDYRITYY